MKYLPETFSLVTPTSREDIRKLKSRSKLYFQGYESLDLSKKYLEFDSEYIYSTDRHSEELVSLEDFLTKTPKRFKAVEYISDFEVYINLYENNLSVGCQTIALANLDQIFDLIKTKKKAALFDLFQSKETYLIWLPKDKVLKFSIGRDDESFEVDRWEITALEKRIKEIYKILNFSV